MSIGRLNIRWESGIRRSPRPAFTLVELLVVLSIIALLVAILAPSLRWAREHAYDVKCKSNLNRLCQILNTGMPPANAWLDFIRGSGGGGVLLCPKSTGKDVGEGTGSPGFSGAIVLIDPPPSVKFGAMEDNSTIHAFYEKENFVLPADVRVNISRPGYVDALDKLSPKVIPAGTIVNCLFLHSDPVASETSSPRGAVTMAGDILGVICLDADLNASDATLGRPGTQYPTGKASRGYEVGTERVTLEADMRTYTINNYNSTTVGEQIRILTGPGGSSSYGMNSKVRQKTPRTDQLLLLEYNKSVADPDSDPFEKCISPNHLDRVNVALVDGSVCSFDPNRVGPAVRKDMWDP